MPGELFIEHQSFLTMKKYFAFGILGILIILSFVSPHLMFNSGELIEEHQIIENYCFSCHTAFHSIPNEKCITCHKLEGDRSRHSC